MQIADINGRKCTLELNVQGKNLNAYNKVHDGVIASLIYSTIGAAAHNYTPEGFGTNTAQLGMHYLRPVKEGEIIRASAEIIHIGVKNMMGNCKIVNTKGEIVAWRNFTILTK